MSRPRLDWGELSKWKSETWQIYASAQLIDGTLTLWINFGGRYRVRYGREVLYEGSQLTHAAAAWDDAK